MNEQLDHFSRLSATLDALCATLQQFEASFQSQHADLGQRIDRIVAAVSESHSPAPAEAAQRLAATEKKLAELEARNSELERQLAAAAPASRPNPASHDPREPRPAIALAAQESLRKTLPPSLCALLAKSAAGEVDAAGHFVVAALDKALGSLSVDQRIAVKAEMARAGLIA
ncbi:MAG TPA: hypothetical protein VE998_07905 [Terriglobales bacterium]|nr:hypothetical protein [Terriglobales bacterium]